MLLTKFSFPADLFRTYCLETEGKIDSYHAEDLNNDGLKDIVVLTLRNEMDNSHARLVSVYFQDHTGFRLEPDQSFTLTDQVILFDFGDVAGDAKKELVFFARGGIFYYSLSDTGFSLSPQKLFETESIFMLSDKKTLCTWDFVSDLNGNFVDEILVPKITKCVIYFRNPGSSGWLINEIPLSSEVQVFGHYDMRFSVGSKTYASYSTPYIVLEDFNSDGRKDLIGVYKDSLVVFCQDETGYFYQQSLQRINLNFGDIWRGAKIQRTHLGQKSERRFLMRVIDLNDDGILDIVGTRISTQENFINPKTEVRIYFGKLDNTHSLATYYFNKEPDQIIKPGGTQLVLDLMDVNHDNKIDLIIPVAKVGLTRIIKMLLTKTVELEAEFYLMNSDGIYPENPNLKTKMVVRFSFRGGAASPVYEIEDFNGDGNLDILSSQEEKRLVIFWGDSKNVINSSVGAKFNVLLPQNGELVRAMDLNEDNKCDVIITFEEEDALHKRLKNVIKILLTNY
ncbi:MAG: FG-GAP repeat domain-containing protein [bacterium]